MKTNCKQCEHVMDSEALTCPNCNAPSKSSINMKPCVKCGTEMEARKKKCSACGELQSQTNNTMAKNNSNKFPLGAILIGVIIGTVIMFVSYPLIKSPQEIQAPVSINDAKALEVEGVLIFIKSEPKAKKIVLGTLTEDNAIEIINKIDGAASGGKNGLEKIFGGLTEAWKNVNMQERIRKFISAAKSEYPEVQGLVFSGSNLKEAAVIKFN